METKGTQSANEQLVRLPNILVLLHTRSSCSDCSGTGSDYYSKMQLVLLDGLEDDCYGEAD